MNYTPIERLAIGTALRQRLDDQIGTKNAANVRGQADAELMERFERTGETAMEVMLNSGKVGTFTVLLTKPTQERRRLELVKSDGNAYRAWAEANGFMVPDDAAIQRHFAESGEVPDGCDVRETVTPGSPGGEVKGTRLVVNADDVIDALGGYIDGNVAGLIGEAMEDDEW